MSVTRYDTIALGLLKKEELEEELEEERRRMPNFRFFIICESVHGCVYGCKCTSLHT